MSKKLTIKKKDNELITKYNKSITISDANLLKLQKAGSMTNYFKSAVKGFKNKATSLQKKVSNKYQATKLRAAMSISQAKESLGKKYKEVKQKAQIASIPYVSKAIKLKKKTQNAVDLAKDLGGNVKRSVKSTTKSLKTKLTPSLVGKSSKKLVESDLDFLISHYNKPNISKNNVKYLTYITNILEIKIKIIESLDINNTKFIEKSNNINILLDNYVLKFVETYIGDWSESYISKLQQGGSIFSSMKAAAKSASSAVKSAAKSASSAVKSASKSASTPNYITQEKNKIPVYIIELEIINKYTTSLKILLKQCYIDNIQYYTSINYNQNELNIITQLQSYTKVCAFLAYATNLIIPDQKGNITIKSISDFINKLNQLLGLNNIITEVNIN